LHLDGILFPHINDDARSKSHQTHTHSYIAVRGLPGCTIFLRIMS